MFASLSNIVNVLLCYVTACTWVVDKIRAACGCAEKDEDVKGVRDRSCVLSGGQIAEKGKLYFQFIQLPFTAHWFALPIIAYFTQMVCQKNTFKVQSSRCRSQRHRKWIDRDDPLNVLECICLIHD